MNQSTPSSPDESHSRRTVPNNFDLSTRRVHALWFWFWNGSSLQSLMPLEIRILWMPGPRSKLVQRPISIRSLKHASLNINKARVERRTVRSTSNPFVSCKFLSQCTCEFPEYQTEFYGYIDWTGPMHSMGYTPCKIILGVTFAIKTHQIRELQHFPLTREILRFCKTT